MADKLVAMTKNGETIHVHPLAVEDHKSLGWKVVEAQPVDEKVVPVPADEGETAPRKATRRGRTAAKADAVDPAAGADSDEGEEPEEEADAAE